MASPRPLRVRAYCPRCWGACDLAGDRLRGPWSCDCGETRELAGPSDLADAEAGRVRRCAFCGCESLYIEKDFHQGLGCLLMVALPAGLAPLLPWPLGISLPVVLLAVTAVDACLYYAVVPFRTVCYHCCAEHRGGALNPAHAPYDLSTAELFQRRADEARPRSS